MASAMPTFLCLICLFAFAPVGFARPLDVHLLTVPKPGEKVIAQVDADGDVGIESDVAQATFVSKGTGPRQVDLGQGRTARFGFLRVHFVAGAEQATLVIPVLASAKTFEPVVARGPLDGAEQLLLTKFFAALKQHGAAYAHTWPVRQMVTENIVKISAAGTLAILCVAEPTKITCVPAAGAAGDLAAEAGLGFAGHAVDEMEKDGSLTKKEAASVRTVLTLVKAGKIALSVALASGTAERLVEGLDTVSLFLDDKSTLRLTIGLQKDSAGKALKLYQILEKL